jgi:hypothetical protein
LLSSAPGLPLRSYRLPTSAAALSSHKEAALFTGVSCQTLEKHRIYRTGQNYSKIDGGIICVVTDLREWAERGARRATSDPCGITILHAKSDDTVSQIEPIRDGATGVDRDAAGEPAILDVRSRQDDHPGRNTSQQAYHQVKGKASDRIACRPGPGRNWIRPNNGRQHRSDQGAQRRAPTRPVCLSIMLVGRDRRLQAAGLNAMAVRNPLTTLPESAGSAERVLARQDGPTVLVGRSFSGVMSRNLASIHAGGCVNRRATTTVPGIDPANDEFRIASPASPRFVSGPRQQYKSPVGLGRVKS